MYYFFVLGRWVAILLPRKISYLLASIIARVKFFFSKRDRENLIYNLLPILKNKKTAYQYARKIVENFAYYLVDFFRFSKIDSEFIEKYVKLIRIDFLQNLIKENKKIIALTAHLGNYELGGALTSILGYKVYAVALPHKDERTNSFFNHQREVCGVEVTSTGIGIKKCFQALKSRKILALLGDKDFSGKGKKVKMFGKTCILPRGVANFSLKTDAYIIPSFLIRENKYTYSLIFDTPISPYRENKKKTEEEIIQECAKILEKYIARYPEQWYMFEKYWIE
ncbi:MAG: lysophospholipid acyltransferase family protein [Candidatus Omnitrophica bacterium]|nr:lysophospholipid acyltransferase family protein [Candidatus Omnitrophota bacterium]